MPQKEVTLVNSTYQNTSISTDFNPQQEEDFVNKLIKSYLYLNSPLKRYLDIFGATIGLIFLFPLFLLACLLVTIIDKVPFLFKQERYGYNGQTFTMYKLRTLKVIEKRDMVDHTRIQKKPQYSTTKTGKFWRISSIDEIIQFWLVLKGDMSLIGHRPIPVYYLPHLHKIENYNHAKVDEYLRCISLYKPGMSSLSSVNGRGDLSMQEKFSYDFYYAQNASFSLDLKLLILTIVAVITGKGAK
ncbi:sugar transferase [Chondrinema litorale]|uniref:sugar transferase n=1 Tax=Chondrinema litorale TaxID=2994555 RepID=UPI0025438221|nr:sugar transferase [Chondrinema litorale]UZR97055.1 sugar transferase [Chondrinema litorale]